MRLGKITENALKRSVLKPLKTQFKDTISAAVGTDCAFSKGGKTYMTVCPVTENIADAGFYAVVKAVNGMVAQSLKPEQVNLGILLPEDAEEPTLKRIINDAIEACTVCDVAYSGGHTEVSRAVKWPVVTATCCGIFQGISDSSFVNGKADVDEDIVLTKWIALEGTAMLSSERFDELTTKYPVPFIDDARQFKNYLTIGEEMSLALDAGITSAHDLSNGGVFAGLWEMASRAGLGMKVDLKKIPIRQETVEICEFFEINPYQLLSGGALLLTTKDGKKLVAALEEKGIPAAIIGKLTAGNDRVIINGEEERHLDLPQTDEILKALG